MFVAESLDNIFKPKPREDVIKNSKKNIFLGFINTK